jgi:ABC-type transporter Mla MlaB component
MAFLARDQVDASAASLLRKYARRTKRKIEPPIDIDGIGEILLDLRWEYSFIEGQPPQTLAALYPSEKIVRLSEAFAERFTAVPGLERFTKGHEIGHWVLHVNEASLSAPRLSDESARGELVFCRDDNKDWTERQADWFAASLLMPEEWVVRFVRQCERIDHAAVARLAEAFGASREAMRIRLENLNIAHFGDNGEIYRSRSERFGQQSLF